MPLNPSEKTVAQNVCVMKKEMDPGAMEQTMLIMIITLTNMEKIHGVIVIGKTGNAMKFFLRFTILGLVPLRRRRIFATMIGSVLVD